MNLFISKKGSNFYILYKIFVKSVNLILKFFSLYQSFFWRFFLKKIGKKVTLGRKFGPSNPENIEINDFSHIGENCQIVGDSGVCIGKYVMIAKNCEIISSNHEYSNYKIPIILQGIRSYNQPIIIEDDVWVGNNVIILPKVKIGKGSIIGAGSVVTKNVEPYSIVAGVPAKFIKFRFTKKIIEKAKKITF